MTPAVWPTDVCGRPPRPVHPPSTTRVAAERNVSQRAPLRTSHPTRNRHTAATALHGPDPPPRPTRVAAHAGRGDGVPGRHGTERRIGSGGEKSASRKHDEGRRKR
jgi:hypothetical protein